MHSRHLLREGARPEVVRDILGHANIDVTQMFTARAGGKSEWMRSAVEAVTNAAQNAEKEEKKNQPESVSNEWVPPFDWMTASAPSSE